ncbi:RecQ family ATP-dependent DNA helicase [Stieleria marina]|uniref:ATP-dependent DNA helicase RecQ n=1 Tax=Stieleria marina TaxID=1930275 RepID=A0A517NYM4_9BACT|nr:ATP-dependent DNA helicase RecQ [Planctomycetes bacterium K23_9]
MASSNASSDAKSDAAALMDQAQTLLREQFGLADFREGQRDVISRLLNDKNTAAVFPTGGGKSLCYQLPSQLFDGTTVVVSPLIALMKDQCDALAERGIAAARLDSTLSSDEFRAAMKGIRDGSIKMLYVSPERFFNERFLASIGSLNVSLFAIDEAHCISQWGHNFRPDYLKLAILADKINAKRILALTATATPSVLEDIRDVFQIAKEDAIRTPFYRPNLQIRSRVLDRTEHYSQLMAAIRERPAGCTLIYVSRQKTAEEIAEQLTNDGFAATAYHAGMDPETRHRVQQEFIASPNGIVVATIAFGMGIDKSDIRYVYHFNPPKSLESYAQEIGRAGRDGEDSICEMFLVPDDRIVLENFTYGETPARQAIGKFIDLLSGQADHFHISHYKLSAETDIRILVVKTLLTYLELEGYLQATSPRYDSYKVKPLVESRSILNQFKGEPREFIAAVLGCLTKGRTWFTLNMTVACKRLGAERERIVKAMDYLAERGWVEMKVSDLVHGYRWQKRIDDPKLLGDDLFDRMAQREASEVARLDDVFGLAQAAQCQADTLSSHFGDTMAEPCGRCSNCIGDGPYELNQTSTRSIGTSARDAVDDITRRFPDHFTTARDRARFLCGLSSPAFVRARITREGSYGVCDGIPFADVVRQLEQ